MYRRYYNQPQQPQETFSPSGRMNQHYAPQDYNQTSFHENYENAVPVCSYDSANSSKHTPASKNPLAMLENMLHKIPFEEIILLGIMLLLLEDKKKDWSLIFAVGYLYLIGNDELCDMLKGITNFI